MYNIPNIYVGTYYIVVVQRRRRRVVIEGEKSKKERKELKKKSEKQHGRERDAIIMSERPGGRIYSYCR